MTRSPKFWKCHRPFRQSAPKCDWLELAPASWCGVELGMLAALQVIGVAATFGSTTSIIALAPREMGTHCG